MNCKNCQRNLTEDTNFCLACGAKVIRNKLTIKNLFEDFSEQFFNYDNKFLKTFITLFKKPEDVIGGYVNGTRKKYVNVVSYFAIALTLAGFQIFVIRKFFPEAMDIRGILPDGIDIPDSTANLDWMYDYMSIITLINLPIYALMARLTFIKLKKFNYTEHLVIMTYIFAQYTITTFLFTIGSAMLGVNFYLFGMLLMLLLMIYTAYCYKRLYPLTMEQIILRFLLFLGVLFVAFIVQTMVQVGVQIYTGEFQEMIEMQKLKSKGG